MVTSNWCNIFKANRAYGEIPGGIVGRDGKTYQVAYNTSSGLYDSVLNAICLRAENVNRSETSGQGIVFGSGSTPPTVDDYNLESMLTSSITATITSRNFGEDNNALYKVSVTNVSTEPVIIGEVGLAALAYTSRSSTTGVSVLIERTVLDSPVTIPPGGTALITYAIELPTVDSIQ